MISKTIQDDERRRKNIHTYTWITRCTYTHTHTHTHIHTQARTTNRYDLYTKLSRRRRKKMKIRIRLECIYAINDRIVFPNIHRHSSSSHTHTNKPPTYNSITRSFIDRHQYTKRFTKKISFGLTFAFFGMIIYLNGKKKWKTQRTSASTNHSNTHISASARTHTLAFITRSTSTHLTTVTYFAVQQQ